ncbi:MAG: ABC transporter permease [Oscillospiraceae bacterium]|nr:ABC transporter permease [Oscillospiraceae bacterium]
MKKRSRVTRLLVRAFGDERRQAFTVPVFAVVMSLAAAAILLLAIGKNPVAAFRALLSGAGFLPKGSYSSGKGIFTDLMTTLSSLTPMIFAALAVTVAFKAGLFNIGVSGQMLFAGFLATVLVGYSALPGYIARPLVILIGIAAGAIAGGVIGLLKYRFNINEVVSSIMINYIFQYVIGFFILTKFVDPVTRHSKAIVKAARLVPSGVQIGRYKTDFPVIVVLAVAASFALKFFLDRTRAGFELRAVGAHPKAAQYAGVKVGRNIVLAMTLSGALAGLAGVAYYLGYYDSITPKALSSVGFDAIAVSLLGNSNPIGGLFASILVTAVDRGSTYMSSAMNVQREISQVITGLILLFSACGAFIRHLVNRAREEDK